MSRKKSSFTIYLGVPKRIKRIRGGLSQAAFGKILGVTQGTVQKYEKGEILPSEEVQKKIAAHGGISEKELLYGEKENLNRLQDLEAETYQATRPAEIQEFLFADVFKMVLNYQATHRLKHDMLHTARLLVMVYNHCATELEHPRSCSAKNTHALIP